MPAPADFDRLPTVTKLRSHAVAAYKSHGSIWEIGWNGTWVKRWAGVWPALEPL